MGVRIKKKIHPDKKQEKGDRIRQGRPVSSKYRGDIRITIKLRMLLRGDKTDGGIKKETGSAAVQVDRNGYPRGCDSNQGGRKKKQAEIVRAPRPQKATRTSLKFWRRKPQENDRI